MTQFRRPSTANVGQARAMGARLSPLTRVSTAKITAAMATRPSAKVRGGKSSSPTLAKKNEPPHKSESTTRRSQSAFDIDNFGAIARRLRNDGVRPPESRAAEKRDDLAPSHVRMG